MTEPRVLFVSSHAAQGGSERYLGWLLGALDRERVAGLVSLADGTLVSDLQREGFEVDVVATSPRLPGIAASAWRLGRIFRRRRPDLVHANGVKAALVSVLAGRLGGPPVLWLKHDVSRDGWQAAAIARRCAAVVGVSRFVVAAFGPNLTNVSVINTGVPRLEIDRDEGRRIALEVAGPGAEHVIALVGRLDPFKGHSDALEVAAAMRSDRVGLRLLFVGESDPAHPSWEDTLRDLVVARHLEDIVTFTGWRADAATIIAGCDALLMPSTSDASGMGAEGFPLVALESLQVGTPVIGYELGGLPEAVGECGLLVPLGDKDGLRDAVLRVTGEPGLRDRLAACGVERARSRFTLERMVAELEERYRQAVR